MRTEQTTAKALVRLNDDKYLLSIAVGKRVKELIDGAKPLVNLDKKKYKFADIALLEIAEGKLVVNVES
ncbi:MAG: DNA-directed RNA polymerase subunit omega [Sulfurovum sp. PC08-66]|jgi:DNA-directed RNA polymerase subunit omega|nr:MAG: DNA-directed RNA polymerase subunit omega [Sulfurovum sp. PC08-66]